MARSQFRNYRAFQHGSGRWYIANVDASGSHGQHPYGTGPGTYSTRSEAQELARRANQRPLTAIEREFSNPARGKGLTLRNMASVTIKRLPGGAVAVTGRKLAGTGRANPGFYRDYEAERGRGRWGVQVVILKSGPRYRAIEGAGWMTKREAQQAAKDRNSGR